MGITSLVECSAAGATATTIAALVKGRLTRRVLDETLKQYAERQLHVHVGYSGGTLFWCHF